jgi:Ca2+:H+ antiporter
MHKINLLGWIAIPLALLVHFVLAKGKSWEPGLTFFLASLGVIPLAHLMGRATEHLSERTGPTWGGLLNATFGNAAELIIALIALSKGLTEIVKASLTGSILGNLLLVGGAAMLVGGWRRERQKFNAHSAEANSGLLALAVAGMMFPAIFHFTAERMHDVKIHEHEYGVSMLTSLILLVVYGLGLLFTLRTHAHIFSAKPHANEHDAHGMGPSWSVRKSVIMLLIAAAAIALVAELLVGSAEKVAERFGWSHVFVGVIVLAIIGNAAEHSTAILMAHRDDMDTAMTITHQSSLQIALFVTPAMVLASALMVKLGIGEAKFMDLIFTPMEVVAIVLTVGIVVVLGLNGESNWFEGTLLLGLYAILAIAFFYIPSETHDAVQSTMPATAP